LESTGIPVPHRIPLHDLFTALYDAQKGVSNPILEIKNQRRGTSTAEWRKRAFVATAVTLYMRMGYKKPAACRIVARRMKHLGIRGQANTDAGRIVERWYEGVSNPRDAAHGYYQTVLAKTKNDLPAIAVEKIIKAADAVLFPKAVLR